MSTTQTLHPVATAWSIETAADPAFSYENSEGGLQIRFIVDLGDDARNADIQAQLQKRGCLDESALPDDIYNAAGYRIAKLTFRRFREMSFFPKEDLHNLVLKDSSGDASLPPAVYEAAPSEAGWRKFYFVGHDLAVCVITADLWQEDLIELCE
ncbi:hypothetical protein OOT46_24190 [Aquabacterium sp. A7-Y]|uniref:hypothetical protein n=1 Tax=Aquabacterium sp. A7-Y TaxID=1349605 RepID=UPI00223DF784|nr:hypothetical protein [Aquabacterium sp. A7-Y]MCW7540926.1 hypothetical protein [Aquabacterium sp. A7-Y]